jgi:hypothetical protein
MVDLPEATWVSTRPWINFCKSTTGSRQEMILRSGTVSAAFVQPVAAPNQKSGPNASLLRKIIIDVAGPFQPSDCGNWCLLIAMHYFTKWPQVDAIPNQEASTVTEALVTNFFCRFGVSREQHSDQGHNFESRIIPEVSQRLWLGKTRTTHLHPKSDGMV